MVGLIGDADVDESCSWPSSEAAARLNLCLHVASLLYLKVCAQPAPPPASTQQSPSLHLLLSAVVTFTVDYRQRMFCAIFLFTLRFTLQAGAPILILHLVSEIFNLKILLHLNIERVH